MLRTMLELATSVAWGVGMLAAIIGAITFVFGPIAALRQDPAEEGSARTVWDFFKIMASGAMIFIAGIALSAWAEGLITRY